MNNNKKDHKFFERSLDNNLVELVDYVLKLESSLKNGKLPGLSKEEFESIKSKNPNFTSLLAQRYNIFQFHNHMIYNLYSNIEDMLKEATSYYEIDIKKEQYMVQGWFNINYNFDPKLNDKTKDGLHDHMNGTGAPIFHGYYCVNAEPSYTRYRINGEDLFDNINKNNRAILSETGHPHGIGGWSETTPRITIAYDLSPLSQMLGSQQQHWIPIG